MSLTTSYDQVHSFGDQLQSQITIGDGDALYGVVLEFDKYLYYYSELDLLKTGNIQTVLLINCLQF